MLKTEMRVNKGLIYAKELFLAEPDFDVAGEYELGVHQNIAVVTVAGGEDLEVKLPAAVLCKGMVFAVRGTVASTGKLTISNLGNTSTVVYNANGGIALNVASLFTSDGTQWYTTSGAAGADGADGDDGADGTTWHHGAVTPDDALGSNGDYYLRTDTGAIYFKAAGTWGTPIVTLTPTT